MDQLGTDFHATGSVMTPAQLQEYRLKRGECVTCGRKCFQKKLFKMTPLTDHGKVLKGRCLNCHPLDGSSGPGGDVLPAVSRRATREDLAKFSKSQSNLARSGGGAGMNVRPQRSSQALRRTASSDGITLGSLRGRTGGRRPTNSSVETSNNSSSLASGSGDLSSSSVDIAPRRGVARPSTGSSSQTVAAASTKASRRSLGVERTASSSQAEVTEPPASRVRPKTSSSSTTPKPRASTSAQQSPPESSPPAEKPPAPAIVMPTPPADPRPDLSHQVPATTEEITTSSRSRHSDIVPRRSVDPGADSSTSMGPSRSRGGLSTSAHQIMNRSNSGDSSSGGGGPGGGRSYYHRSHSAANSDYDDDDNRSPGDDHSYNANPDLVDEPDRDEFGHDDDPYETSARHKSLVGGSSHVRHYSSDYEEEEEDDDDDDPGYGSGDLIQRYDQHRRTSYGSSHSLRRDGIDPPRGAGAGLYDRGGGVADPYALSNHSSVGRGVNSAIDDGRGGDEESFTNASETYDDYAPLPEFRPTGEEIQDALERITGGQAYDTGNAAPLHHHHASRYSEDDVPRGGHHHPHHHQRMAHHDIPSNNSHDPYYDPRSQRSMGSRHSSGGGGGGIVEAPSARARSRESHSNRSLYSDRSGHNTEEEIAAYESSRSPVKHGILNRGGAVDLLSLSNSEIKVPEDVAIGADNDDVDDEDVHYRHVLNQHTDDEDEGSPYEEDEYRHHRDHDDDHGQGSAIPYDRHSGSGQSYNGSHHSTPLHDHDGGGASMPYDSGHAAARRGSGRNKNYSSNSARSLDSMSSFGDGHDILHDPHHIMMEGGGMPVHHGSGGIATEERQESMNSFPSRSGHRSGGGGLNSSNPSLSSSAGRQASREHGLHSSSNHSYAQRSYHSTSNAGHDSMSMSGHSNLQPRGPVNVHDKHNGSGNVSNSQGGDTYLNSSGTNYGGGVSGSRQDSQGSHLSLTEEGLNRLTAAGENIVEIVHVMLDYPISEPVQTNCMHDISNLHLEPEDCDAFADAGGMEAIVDAMEHFPKEEELQLCACRALCNVSGTQENQMALVDVGAADVLLGHTMETFRDHPELQEQAMAALANLAALEANLEPLLEKEVVPRVVQSMNKHGNDIQVQMKGCSVITNLASHPTPMKSSVMMAGGGGAVVLCMVLHSKDPQLQEKGLQALRNLSANCEENKVELAHIGGIDASITAMQVHRDDPYVQEAGAWTLCNLAGNMGNKKQIGDSAGIDVVIRAMWVHSDQVTVHEWCVRALFSLTLHPSNCPKTMEVGGISAVVNSMQAHEKSPVVQEMGCAVLCNLANNEQAKLRIVDEEALDAIVLAMVLFGDDVKVQERACQVLLQLAIAQNLTPMQAANVVELVRVAVGNFPEHCGEPAQEFMERLEEFTVGYNSGQGIPVTGGGA